MAQEQTLQILGLRWTLRNVVAALRLGLLRPTGHALVVARNGYAAPSPAGAGVITFADVFDFARYALAHDRLLLQPIGMQDFGGITEMVLFRSPPWQIEMAISPGRALVPVHRHNRVESCDVVVTGSIVVAMSGRRMTFVRPAELTKRMLHIPKGQWHAGEAGEQGGAFLSFQKWDGELSFITDDWEPRESA